MKLKIISDGTCAGTKIVCAETGRELENVSSVFWRVYAGEGSKGFAEAQITLQFAVADIEGTPVPDLDDETLRMTGNFPHARIRPTSPEEAEADRGDSTNDS